MLKLSLRSPKKRPSALFRSRRKVVEGLKAAAVTIWQNDEKQLPTSIPAFEKAIQIHEPVGPGKPRRLYPSGQAILNHFESMAHAWNSIGFDVQVTARRLTAKVITQEVHEKLERIYQFQGVAKHKRPADVPTVREYAAELSKDGVEVGRHILCCYARKQGWTRVKEAVWSREELRLLQGLAHLSPVVIRQRFAEAGFKRTVTAIGLMRKRRNAHKGAPYYSGTAAARLLGVDSHKFDREWLKKFPDELVFVKKGSLKHGGQHGDTRLFHVDTLRKFFWNHPEEVDLTKVDKIWFLWLISNGKVKMIAPSSRLTLRCEGFQPDKVIERPYEELKKYRDTAKVRAKAA